MTNIRTDVWGHEIDLDTVDPRVRAVAIAISFGSAGEDMAGWWNHLGTARETIRIIDFWEG